MLTIGRLAKRAQLTTDSIRFYERLGLLTPATRTESGYRLYSDDTLRRLGFIKHAQRCGFSLADIRELLGTRDDTAGDALHRKAVEKRAQVEETIVALRAMSDALSCLIEDADRLAEPFDSPESPLLSALQAATWQETHHWRQETAER